MTTTSKLRRRPAKSIKATTEKPTTRPTKAAAIRRLLTRPKGATLADLQKATGWQAHSVRSALAGLRKTGVAVERSKAEGGPSIYRIVDDR